jgi:hypothetical protein
LMRESEATILDWVGILLAKRSDDAVDDDDDGHPASQYHM